jgi:hypothetical protein
MITFVHNSPQTEWFPLVESAFGNDCARKLANAIRDRNSEANPQKVFPQMKVSDILFFMDCEMYMSQTLNIFISSDESSHEDMLQESNDDKGSSKKKSKKRNHMNFACKKCGNVYHHPDAVRKHARLKHPEWYKTCKGPKHYIVDAKEVDNVDL